MADDAPDDLVWWQQSEAARTLLQAAEVDVRLEQLKRDATELEDGLRRLTAEHPIEEVGAKLRAMMPWIGKNKLVDKAVN